MGKISGKAAWELGLDIKRFCFFIEMKFMEYKVNHFGVNNLIYYKNR